MKSEGQRIVQELDPSDEDTFPGRHRAPASAARRLSVRLGIAALGVLLTTGLGAVTADVLGLTQVGEVTAQAGPPPVRPAPPDQGPRPRTIDLRSEPALPSPPSPAPLPGDPSPERPAPAAAASAEEPPAVPDAGGTPSPTPVPRVSTGDSCAVVGQTAMTGKGDTAVCTASPGKGPNKWRAA